MSVNVASAELWRVRRLPFNVLAFPLRIAHAWTSAPVAIFLLTLTAMLFRPPDLKTFPVDRVALAVLVLAAVFNICLHRVRLRTFSPTWPLLALTSLGMWSVLNQPYEPQAWSLLAGKWLVPLILFHLAGLVFQDANSLQKLETFCLLVLGYLSLISVLFLLDESSLIYPRFILDGNIGIHVDRARGPFLQAVANGVCLTLLGIIALDSFRRRRLRGFAAGFLFLAVPVALLATKTRAVWLSGAISIVLLACFAAGRVRRAAFAIVTLALVGLGCALVYQDGLASLAERLEDRSPVDFRAGMYRAGWQMFAEKPVFGWGAQAVIQPEVAKLVSDFHPDYYVFHNTYLELAVERGVVGLGFYVWLIVSLCRLRNQHKEQNHPHQSHFLDSKFGNLWPLMLGVYFFNASAVVMNYQFVNGFVFTIAGILAAQQQGARERVR